MAGDKEIILAKLLGATGDPSVQRLTLYIPNKDKHGNEIKKLDGWLKKAREMLTVIGGGVPPCLLRTARG